MEADVDKAKVAKKWKDDLLKAKPKSANGNKVKYNRFAEDKIVLTQKDYVDLIQWKEERKNRNNNYSRMFFFIGLTASLLMVLTAFEWKFYDDGAITELMMEDADFEEFQDIPLTEQPPPPPPQKILQQPKIIEVPDEEVLEEIEVELDVEVTEDMIVEEVELTMEEEPEEEADEIFLIVEDKPEPKGGMPAFYKYVGDNIKYPREASRFHVEGRVFVQFVVNKKGELTDVKVVKGIGAGCDEEAVRIIQNAPDWQPGKQRGRAVSVRMVLPITFKLAD